MDLGIKGKVALVTAASKGLGKAVARQLAAEGVKVAICSRNQETLDNTVHEIKAETGGIVRDYVCDVTDEIGVKNMIPGHNHHRNIRLKKISPDWIIR